MPPQNWYSQLCANPGFEAYSRPHKKGWLVLDKTKTWHVLPMHSKFENYKDDSSAGYWHIKVDNIKQWVPLLPGYAVIIYLNAAFYRLGLASSEDNSVMCVWEKYTENVFSVLSSPVAKNASNDKFHSLLNSVTLSGGISVPSLLGLDIPAIVTQLQAKIAKIYPNLFDAHKKEIAAIQTFQRVESLAKRKAADIDIALEEAHTSTLIKEGLLVSSEGISLEAKSTQSLIVELRETKRLLANANRTIKRLKQQKTAHIALSSDSEEQHLIDQAVKNTIEETKLGSTILMSTEQYFAFVFSQFCSNCHSSSVTKKKWKITTHNGLSVTMQITCKICKTVSIFSNESENTNFAALSSLAGLAAGMNRHSYEMFLATMGITSQIDKKTYHRYQKSVFAYMQSSAKESASRALQKTIEHINEQKSKYMEISFDVSWSHVRNASQASGEILYQGLSGKHIIVILTVRTIC
jgi:hypothetical protein